MFKSLLIAGGIYSANAVFYTDDSKMQSYMWKSYVQEYGKTYSTAAEERTRFGIFVENLKVIDSRNQMEAANNGSGVHGITKFSDLTQHEFETTLLGSKSGKSKSFPGIESEVVSHIPAVAATTSVDWSGIYTTPVKDQGYCGSCWAFSATEQLESDAMRILGVSYVLSSEQTTQCTNYVVGGGCNGGFTESAYHYIKTSGGLVQDSDYPYTKTTYEGVTGACTVDTSEDVVTLTGFTTITGESNMANYVLSTGPLSVCVAAEVWNTYTSGVLSVCPGGVDHCVQAVGVNTGANGYWKVRNSWGTRWGESGYIRLAYGKNTCQITDDPTYVDAVMA